jgi:hypothetical protein
LSEAKPLERRCWLYFIHWKRGHGQYKDPNNDKPLFGKFRKKGIANLYAI